MEIMLGEFSTDAERFTETLSSVVGKRLIYRGLTGKEQLQGELLQISANGGTAAA